jgi:hypothetical protein
LAVTLLGDIKIGGTVNRFFWVNVGSLLLAVAVACAAEAPGGNDAIEADAELQALIERYDQAARWTPEFYQHVIALRERAREKEAAPRLPKRLGPPVNEGSRRLIQQAALYFSQRSAPGKFKALMDDLGGDDYPNYGIMSALLPYLETKDQRLRGFILTEVLDGDGQNEAFERDERDPVVSAMLRYIAFDVKMPKREMPWRVVQIMYWKAPSAAVGGFMKSREESRDVQWARHVVQDVLWKKGRGFLKPGEMKGAIAELDKLSKSDDWAVKLYVAEMLRRHEEFREKEIVERLRKDEHPLVAKALDVPFREEEKEERGFFGL